MLGTGTAFLSRQGSVLVSLSLSLLVSRVSVVAYLAQETPLFPPPLFAQREKPRKYYYQQATYKDKMLTFPQQSAMFLLQETSCLNAIVTTRSTYDESRKICPGRT